VPEGGLSASDGAPLLPAACFACGEPLAVEGDADGSAVESPGVEWRRCDNCGVEQVTSADEALCDGERVALRHALDYLRRRREGQPG